MSSSREVVCVDLDRTLARHFRGQRRSSVIGDPLPGAVEFVRRLSESFDVVILSSRCDGREGTVPHEEAARIVTWLNRHGFTYDSVWCGPGKPDAVAYVDDKAVECRPQDYGEGEFESALAVVLELAGG